MMIVQRLRQWAKAGNSPLARNLWSTAKALRTWSCPVIPAIHRPLYALHQLLKNTFTSFTRIFYWTPLFKTRLAQPAPHLYLYSGMPQLIGPLYIQIGSHCQISGISSFIGRQGSRPVELHIGDRCHIGWQTTIAVGRKVILGDDVYMAGKVFLAGFPGHPLNPEERAAGLPEHDEQTGDIILEDKVWLGTGVMVNAGVRIGAGTVVAAGSIVTHDLPARVLAAGVPAKVIRALPESEPMRSTAQGIVTDATSPSTTNATYSQEDPTCSRH
ncbi:acyltransferase [Plesiomonas shigelloides]|uniref:acyltransferase n=1 Tax=Plesiomonas shigelloides TaxID=703 RepID=UPI002246518F|nr:acyltransferase [Plesiomonas shigelloides]MCX2499168.1 acyltransferase [Plesiomonas shigelloides]